MYNGRAMKFTEYGKKNSDTIILLHGAGLSSWNYRQEAGILASRFHVILPVLDGHEGSDRPFTSIKSAAEEIIDFIDTYCGGSVLAIGGLSLGGQILLEIAARRNGISRFFIFESTLAIPMRVSAVFVSVSVYLSYPLIKHKWFSRLQAKTLGMPADLFEEYYDSSIHISKESLLRMLRENAVFVPDPAIKDINALVIIGSRERRIMLRSARRLSKMIEGSRIRILHGYSHGELSLEHPNEYAELLMKMIYGKL